MLNKEICKKCNQDYFNQSDNWPWKDNKYSIEKNWDEKMWNKESKVWCPIMRDINGNAIYSIDKLPEVCSYRMEQTILMNEANVK